MKSYLPIIGLALIGMLAVGTGCADDSDLFGTGGKVGSSTDATPTPSPSPTGNDVGGGAKND